MVAQIICVVCSLAPDTTEKTTEITFHRFPCDDANQSHLDAWRNAVTQAIGRDIEIELRNTYICSRHFTQDDFSFVDGKLILKSAAVPSVFPKKPTTVAAAIEAHEPQKEVVEKPPTHGNNFASTSTINFVTFSRNYPRTTSTCTETSKTSTPSVCVSLSTSRDDMADDETLKALEANRLKIVAYQRRTAAQRQKIRRMSNLLRQLRRDNLLTDEYMVGLSRTMPRTIKLLETIIASKQIK